jgi:hypothetical protein
VVAWGASVEAEVFPSSRVRLVSRKVSRQDPCKTTPHMSVISRWRKLLSL